MMATFYKQKPIVDVPYRQLIIECEGENVWRVHQWGGEKWGYENRKSINVLPASSYEEARELYDREFRKLRGEGWESYDPDNSW